MPAVSRPTDPARAWEHCPWRPEVLAALRGVVLFLPCLREPFVVGEAVWV